MVDGFVPGRMYLRKELEEFGAEPADEYGSIFVLKRRNGKYIYGKTSFNGDLLEMIGRPFPDVENSIKYVED